MTLGGTLTVNSLHATAHDARSARTRLAAAGFVLPLLAALAGATPAFAGNATVPGALTTRATRVCAGFEWRITGDDNRDCAVSLEYRAAGTPSWQPAQPLWRVHDGLWTHGEDPGSLLAGSLFNLSPSTAYEARLTLADPDGGAEQRTVSFTTRAEPHSSDERVLRVTPGTGGGSGTPADPFRGLASADAAARPGDTFLLGPGTYHGTFTATRDGTEGHAIAYRGLDPATVILDGDAGSSAETVGVRLDDRAYVFLENLSVVNVRYPVRADRTLGVVIRGCTVRPVYQPLGIEGIRAGASRDLTLEDNTVLMNGAWETIGRTGPYGYGGYGILVEGSGHVIAHNTIVEAWDAISLPVSEAAVPEIASHDIDIYENFVDRASDDGIQADALYQNIRIFRNRLLNTGSAVSFQPLFGGPGYIVGNEMFNTRIEPYKFHQETFYGWTQETSGFLVYNNTSICSRNAWYESGIWHDARFRNNLILGARPNEPSFLTGATLFGGDFDHDGWNRVGSSTTLIRYNGSSYADLPAFAASTGSEAHGVEVSTSAFTNATLPHHPEWNFNQTPYGVPYAVGDVDLTLPPGSIAIDRGTPLANITDGFTGGAPDLGCHERGLPLPVYGARTGSIPAAAPERVAPLALAPASPNPFVSTTLVRFRLDRPDRVTLEVYDLSGARVRTLLAGERSAGEHTARWDGRATDGRLVAAGVYLVRLRAGSREALTKVARLR